RFVPLCGVSHALLRALAFRLQRGLDHAGAVLGPLLAWWLLASGTANVRRVIAWSLAPGVLVLVLAVWAVRGRKRRYGAVGEGAAADPLPPPTAPDPPLPDRKSVV